MYTYILEKIEPQNRNDVKNWGKKQSPRNEIMLGL